ncbi:YbdD/YjiX family protein [Frigoribacterium sp. CG_9.8]|uniref:YbdD/YjiX family protein n=1 Tax=Frigoribacterium sp. CG_9.8 TaxID=2787733 RepID=UPI0018C97AE6|nr:uncharacterized short protein YbdD (DUF466 family) [Frigoribacterium sp. CG_9.8]
MSRSNVAPTVPVARSTPSPRNLAGWLVACSRGIHWYLRELMGDSSYARYLAHRATHNDPTPPQSEREFWRQKHRDNAASPRSRCC